MRFFRSRGYKVKFDVRAGLVYSEGPRRMTIDSDNMLAGAFDVAVYAESIRGWEAPYDSEAITDDDRLRIIDNVPSDLKRHGLKVKVYTKIY